jgi:hypothetical protein
MALRGSEATQSCLCTHEPCKNLSWVRLNRNGCQPVYHDEIPFEFCVGVGARDSLHGVHKDFTIPLGMLNINLNAVCTEDKNWCEE